MAYSQPVFGSALIKCTSTSPGKVNNRPKTIAGHSINLFLFDQDQQPVGGRPDEPCQGHGCQRFVMRSGSARVPIEQLLTGTKVEFLDIENCIIAVCEAKLFVAGDTGDEFHSAVGVTLPSTAKLLEQTREAFTKLPRFERTNVHSSLPAFDFLQVQQHFGPIPMWAFPLLNLTKRSETDCTPYVENALANAMFLLGINAIDTGNKAELAELLSEMQTLALRAQLYVLDYTRRAGGEYKQVDKWENPLVSPNPSLMSYDCEDATVRILQEGIWLRMCKSSELLRPLIAAEEAYFTFLVGMTLKLSPSSQQWCYHAAILKLDKQYVRWKLGLAKEPDARERWPAVLLEGTNYTTGCWDYKCRFANADALSERSYTDAPVETIPKITPGLIHEKGLYGAIQSLFSHELARDMGIVQIELAQNGKRAALAKSVMQYDKSVEWFPIRIKGDFKETVDTLYTEAYPAIQPPKFTGPAAKIDETWRPSPQIDCLVRYADFDESVAADLAKEFGKPKLQSRVLKIGDDLRVVHLTAS